MQTSARRRPASSAARHLAPRSIRRSPCSAGRDRTAQRAGVGDDAVNELGCARRNARGGPCTSALLLRSLSGACAYSISASSSKRRRQLSKAPLRRRRGGEDGGDGAPRGMRVPGVRPVGGPLGPEDGLRWLAGRGRRKALAAARAPRRCRAAAGVRAESKRRGGLRTAAVRVVEHVERGAGTRIDVQQVRRACPRR